MCRFCLFSAFFCGDIALFFGLYVIVRHRQFRAVLFKLQSPGTLQQTEDFRFG